MSFSSFGRSYLKAQMQNNTAKVRCDLYQREITKKHFHSLAVVSKNIRDMENFLKDVKASSGYCNDIREFSSLYQSKFAPAAAETAAEDSGITSLNKTCTDKSAGLSDLQVFKTEIPDPGQRMAMVVEAKFGAEQVDEATQLRDTKAKRDFAGEDGCSIPAKNAMGAGKGSGHERGGRSHDRNTKADRWSVRDENLTEMDGRGSSGIAKNRKPAENRLNSDGESKPRRSRSFLQGAKNALDADRDFQNAETQVQGRKTYRETRPPAEPRPAWTDGPPKNRDPPMSSSKVGRTVSRSQTAPAKASRVKSASASERNLEGSSTAKHQSSGELRKLKVHVSLSKTERRRILQELISNSTVTPDRSVLERERQALLKDKISKFFESLSELENAERGNDEEEIFHNDRGLQGKYRGY